MAMQSGSVMVPDKVPVQWYSHQQQQQQLPHHHQVDEKEAILMWLRSEFAAANAMIDALCHHLRGVGDPGEYEGVIVSIQQRRCNWNPVLHMQQYFPIADVVYSLQQVGWKRQQWGFGVEGSGRAGNFGKEFRRGGRGYRGGGGFEGQNYGSRGWSGKEQSNGHVKGNGNLNEKLDIVEKEEKDEKKEFDEKSEANGFATREGLTEEAASQEDGNAVDAGSLTEDGSGSVSSEKPKATDSPKTFISCEMHDGVSVNIAEGMKLYEDLFESSDISKLGTLVNDLRTAGRKGQLQGHAFIVSKRPIKGHGREMIQLGIPTADAPPEDDSLAGTPKDMKTEPIPESLQQAIEQLLAKQVISVKPDSCIIDIFNEGDHSQPHSWPNWFGRPICLLFLTDCDMSFGKTLTAYQPGDYRGALKLSLNPGAVLVMEGRSADFARHAIPSIRKQRILITLIKSLPKKATSSSDPHRFHTSSPPSAWSPPPPTRSPNHTRRPASPSGVLPTPTVRPQLPPPNGIQPLFVPAPVAAFPPPPLRQHPAPRILLPGTGVFLPPQGPNTPSSAPPNPADEPEALNVSHSACNGSLDNDEHHGEHV